mmetsp:Transcript_34201/g.96933  ORF Transcript_34201/g.96933 Transcript_34201/m.96933 type:complete len:203 (+) Transcript_34201:490-1098(+)
MGTSPAGGTLAVSLACRCCWVSGSSSDLGWSAWRAASEEREAAPAPPPPPPLTPRMLPDPGRGRSSGLSSSLPPSSMDAGMVEACKVRLDPGPFLPPLRTSRLLSSGMRSGFSESVCSTCALMAVWKTPRGYHCGPSCIRDWFSFTSRLMSERSAESPGLQILTPCSMPLVARTAWVGWHWMQFATSSSASSTLTSVPESAW